MKKYDLVWAAALAAVVAFLVFPATHDVFASLSKTHPYAIICEVCTAGHHGRTF